jgi:adenine/guanine/hypoxanthine permease
MGPVPDRARTGDAAQRVFAYTVMLGMGIPWEVALASTFVSGVLFFLVAISVVREIVINAIPMQMKLAIGARIGLRIAFMIIAVAG